MSSTPRAILATAGLLALLLACGRDQDSAEGIRTPIVETRLRTPKGQVRVGQALSSHTPKVEANDQPVVRDVSAPTAAPTSAPVAQATAEPKAPPPAAEPTPIRMAARKGVVPRGVELAEAPRGRVLGEFQGRTDVEVLEDRDGWSRVRTQVIGGGGIVGWVETARIADPAAKPASAKAAPADKKAQVAAADGGAKAPAAKSAAAPKAAAAKKPAGNGPDNINLVPIAGTEKKRPATPFTHKAHWEDYSIKCETCHHPVKAKGGAVPSYSCSSSGCHLANECNNATVAKKNKACPNFEDAYHMQCIDCHKKDGGPTKCAECHTG